MFALCGVMIIVGIVYIRNAPQPAPAEPVAAVAAPAAELAASVGPTSTSAPADVPTTAAKPRSVSLDALAREEGAPQTSVSTIATTATTIRSVAPAPPTTTRPAAPAAVTTTVAPPPTTAVTTTVAPAAITLSATPSPPVPGAPTTTAVPVPVVAPTTAVAAAAKVYGHNDAGIASWFNAPDNTCAHRTLPFGTMVKVTRVANGASAVCKVNDRGPTVATGRLIDLSMDTFAKLASTSAGLVDVTIEW